MGKQIQTLTSELNHTKLILQRNENTSSLPPKNAVNSSLQNTDMINKNLYDFIQLI